MGKYETVWRAFEENEISHSAAHYLLAIESFVKIGLEPKSADLARILKVSRAAVSLQLKSLQKQDLIMMTKEGRVLLSKRGTDLVARIISKREIFKNFLTTFLGVSEQTAELDGCKIEHLLSEETGRTLDLFNQFMSENTGKAAEFKKEFDKFIKRVKI